MSSTMQAYRLHTYTGPTALHLDTIPLPTPTPTQALIKTSHAALNPFDWKIAHGYVKDHMPLPLPYTLGVDFIGTITTPGTSGRFKEGDRVMTMSRSLGAFAEYIAVEEAILARVPEGLGDAEACTLPIPALSAWQSLYTAGEVKAGMKVLIHGASGVVGALAVQLAKKAGAEVIGTASGKNRAFVEGLGVDTFIDYTKERFEDVLDKESIDLVLDYVLIGGTDNTTDRSWSVLKKGGAIVSLADPSILGKIPEGKKGFFPEIVPDVEVLEKLGRMLKDGEIQAKVAKVYPREQLVEGMEANKAGGTVGRLLVNFRKA